MIGCSVRLHFFNQSRANANSPPNDNQQQPFLTLIKVLLLPHQANTFRHYSGILSVSFLWWGFFTTFLDNLTKIKDYKMQIKHRDSQIINEILLVAKSEPIVIFIIFKHLTTNSPGIFHLQRGILSISPFTLVKVLEFKDNREVHRMITQTNSTLPVVTLRRIFGTTRCLGAAFSASHQPSSLELTTKKVKILQQKKKVKHYQRQHRSIQV